MVENETHEGENQNDSEDNTDAHIPAPTPERVKEEASDFDLQDETERETFPASDPQSSWAGPADPRDR